MNIKVFFSNFQDQRERNMAYDRAKMTLAMKFDLISTKVQDVCEAHWDSPPMTCSIPPTKKPGP